MLEKLRTATFGFGRQFSTLMTKKQLSAAITRSIFYETYYILKPGFDSPLR